MTRQEVWVNRGNFRNTHIVEGPVPDVAEGEILLAVESFALTANNVSYALSGDMIGYWGYFPAEGHWGKVPAWGYARVLASRCADIAEGERLWGFLPMATHLVLQPGHVSANGLVDVAEHRKALPALYNGYTRTLADPPKLADLQHERSLLFPLFATSYLLYDYLVDNDFFAAAQVIIGSASSKTAFGLARLLYSDSDSDSGRGVSVCGLTSASNVDFAATLDAYHSVLPYEDVDRVAADAPAVFVDMAGDAALTAAVHQRLGDQLVQSIKVGATHWEAPGAGDEALPGPAPAFFFAPAHIARRDKEWGQGVVMQRALSASADLSRGMRGLIQIEEKRGADAVIDTWTSLLDNRLPPSLGMILSL